MTNNKVSDQNGDVDKTEYVKEKEVKLEHVELK